MPSVDQVGPGADDEPGPVEQLGLVAPQLVEQDPLLLGRRALVGRRPGRAGDQDPGPLDVAQELVAEAPALAGALDEAGDVGDHELVPSSRRTTPRLGSSVVNG